MITVNRPPPIKKAKAVNPESSSSFPASSIVDIKVPATDVMGAIKHSIAEVMKILDHAFATVLASKASTRPKAKKSTKKKPTSSSLFSAPTADEKRVNTRTLANSAKSKPPNIPASIFISTLNKALIK